MARREEGGCNDATQKKKCPPSPGPAKPASREVRLSGRVKTKHWLMRFLTRAPLASPPGTASTSSRPQVRGAVCRRRRAPLAPDCTARPVWSPPASLLVSRAWPLPHAPKVPQERAPLPPSCASAASDAAHCCSAGLFFGPAATKSARMVNCECHTACLPAARATSRQCAELGHDAGEPAY